MPRSPPVESWRPSLPIATRRTVLLAGVLVSLLTLACLLLPTRRSSVLAITGVLIGSVVTIQIWAKKLSSVADRVAGTVLVERDGSVRIDRWEYFGARTRAQLTIDLDEGAIPVFVDAAHARAAGAVLDERADGSRRTLRVVLAPGERVAVLTRSVAAPGQAFRGSESGGRVPMASLARASI